MLEMLLQNNMCEGQKMSEQIIKETSRDKESRDLIIKDLSRNFFVEASAGSGKTTSLVYRMVALVEKGVPVDKICTITFTKAAADEFFSRFQKMLSIRSVFKEDKTDEYLGKKSIKTVQRCQEALNNIDSCFLGTIDAFCNMIAHEFPFELGIPSDAKLISNEDFEVAVKEEFEKLLKNADHPLHEYALKFKDCFMDAYSNFAKGINLIKEKRNCEIVFDRELIDVDIKEYLSEYSKDLLGIFKELSKAKINFGTGDTPSKRKKNFIKFKYTLNKLNKKNWNECVSDLYWCLNGALKNGNDRVRFPINEVKGRDLEKKSIITVPEGGRASLADFSEWVIAVFKGVMNKIYSYLFSLFLYVVTEALEEIAGNLKKEGLLQFSDFLYYLNNTFKKSSADGRILLNHILERHSYFLLDENQDTNPMQTEIFFYLTGTKETDDWTKTEPKEGSLFIVGDPKQSIYAFRGANVQAYLNTEKIFRPKDEVLELSKNFRSSVELREWFNATMDKILNNDKAESLEHKPIEISKEDYDLSEKIDYDHQNDDIFDGAYKYLTKADNDADDVAKIIKEFVNNPNKKIVCKNDKGDGYRCRTVDYKDFLVVPIDTKVEKLVDAFDNYQIPYYIEASIPLEESKTLMVLFDLVFLLKNPTDKAALLKVLANEDLYDFSDIEIVELVNAKFSFDVSNIDGLNISNSKLLKAINQLHSLYELTKNLSFSSTLLVALNDKNFGMLKRVDSKYYEYTYFLIELIKTKEEDGSVVTLEQLKKFFDSVLNGSEKQDRVLRFKNELNKVKIANLHKVKGLQAPIVILCKPFAYNMKQETFTDYSTQKPTFYIQSLTTKKNDMFIKIIQNPDFPSAIEMKMIDADKSEKERLEYVGATRAESVLLVGVSQDKDREDRRKPWAHLTDNISDDRIYQIPDIATPEEIETVDVDYENPNLDKNCEKQTIKYHSPSNIVGDYKLSPRVTNVDDMNDNGELLKKDRDDALLIGSMVHRLMQSIVLSQNNISDVDSLIGSIASEYGGDKYIELLKNVYKTIVSGGYPQNNSSINQDILKTLMNAKDVRTEVPFSIRKGDTIVSGSIDLLYEDDRGYHIIDYKTNNTEDISSLEEEYRGQLNDYIDAMKQFGIEADAHIYHIRVN